MEKHVIYLTLDSFQLLYVFFQKLIPYLEVLNLSHNNLKKAINLEVGSAIIVLKIYPKFNCVIYNKD